ncbi:ABC transporter substrate-binding protein [Bifidobacterium vespertilionis]|uniref:Sugar ABC transporter substrate-binding protein n=1 Tax=Bifidobacterium vespertilionis TaxID=2562524 RepID=A0A5J5DYA5_9BIFI|nr:sugar ABC transporter substrate-binding protein [Bifidobacterium vespertilionis]KAA8821722.1 sugar ABC transporter substrate-binding protein [Bifidobacterium vespertilionis]KAA8824802.1 sugar ABC transporter substrate-binding protein [Bifidobacterium vespertilionis]MBT1178232.1 sugar ABC transporter substrate-binding protein [Bifidobacterium vespertilionis]
MRTAKKIMAASAAVASMFAFTACGESNTNATPGAQPTDTNTAEAKGEITFWGWDSGNAMGDIIAAFEKANPGITVNFNNTGTAEKTSTALTNAISAGKGAPDVVMLEDPTVTQFAVTGDLLDLTAFGADKLADDYAAGPWNKLQYNNAPYALPIDSGPEMFFYNKAVFDKAGVDGESIKTWDDYYEAAKKIRATGAYITNMAGTSNDYQPFTAQAWQAGAQPWKVDGTKITINMSSDAGLKKYTDFVQKLIDEDLVDTKTSNWSDAWNRGLNDGSIASLTIGAWMPTNLISGAPDQAGNWRVAQLPQWESGKEVSAEDGGSALAVVKSSASQAAAYKFIEYLTHGDGAQLMADTGTFPSLKKILSSSAFTDPNNEANKKTNDYFGGQNVNQVLAEAAQRPTEKFQYLPYNPFAQTAYGDEVSKAYTKEITLAEAMKNYANKLAEQGKSQGYDVTVE